MILSELPTSLPDRSLSPGVSNMADTRLSVSSDINSFSNPYQHILSSEIQKYLEKLTGHLRSQLDTANRELSELAEALLKLAPQNSRNEEIMRDLESGIKSLREQYGSKVDMLRIELLFKLESNAKAWGEKLAKISDYQNLGDSIRDAIREFNKQSRRAEIRAIRKANKGINSTLEFMEENILNLRTTFQGVTVPKLTLKPLLENVAKHDLRKLIMFQQSMGIYGECRNKKTKNRHGLTPKILGHTCLRSNRFVSNYSSFFTWFMKLEEWSMGLKGLPPKPDWKWSDVADERFKEIIRDYRGEKGDLEQSWQGLISYLDGKIRPRVAPVE